jgi:hypothetical protein
VWRRPGSSSHNRLLLRATQQAATAEDVAVPSVAAIVGYFHWSITTSGARFQAEWRQFGATRRASDFQLMGYFHRSFHLGALGSAPLGLRPSPPNSHTLLPSFQTHRSSRAPGMFAAAATP